MSKKITTRVLAVVVVGLSKFLIHRSDGSRRAPWIELVELAPRVVGQSIAHHQARLVKPTELEDAALVVVNGKVVKSSDTRRSSAELDQNPRDASDSSVEYGAVEGSPLTVAARGVLETFAAALLMSPDTGARPLILRISELVKVEAEKRADRVKVIAHQRLLELLRAALQPVVTVGDPGELAEEQLLEQVAELVRWRQEERARAEHFKPRPGDGLALRRGRALLKVRAIELEGENLSIEAIGEAIKVATGGGDDGAQ